MPTRLMAQIVALSMLAALSACGNAPPVVAPTRNGSPVAIRIGVSFDILNNIRHAEKAAIEAKAAELGATVEFVVAEGDAQRQVRQISELLAKRVDVIIAIAQDKDAIISVIRQANAAGVPFLTLDRAVGPGAEVLFHISADPYSDGQAAGAYIAGLAAAGTPMQVLVLVGSLADTNAVERNRGFKTAVANQPGVQIIAEEQTDWNPDTALASTRAVFERFPQANAIFCPSDYLLPAVLSALQGAGKLVPPGSPGYVTIVSIDGDPFGYSKTADGTIAANVATMADTMGARVTVVAVQAVRGQRPERSKEVVPGLLFTTRDAKQQANKIWGARTVP